MDRQIRSGAKMVQSGHTVHFQMGPHRTLSYRFSTGCAADDITGLIRELALSSIRWKGLEGFILVVQDIRQAFDNI